MSVMKINLQRNDVLQIDEKADLKFIEESVIQLEIPSVTVPYRYLPNHSTALELTDAQINAMGLKGPVRIWKLSESMTIPKISDDKGNNSVSLQPQLIVKSALQSEGGLQEKQIMHAEEEVGESSSVWRAGTQLRLRLKRSSTTAPAFQNKVYSLIGVNEADVVLLERLLQLGRTNLNSLGLQVRLLYFNKTQDVLQTVGENPHMFIMQENLSTITHPSASLEPFSALQESGLIPDAHLFFSKLWEGSITRSGGYRLYFFDEKEQRGLPDEVFNVKGELEAVLMIMFSDKKVESYLNCLITGGLDPASPTNSVYAEWEREHLSIDVNDPNENLERYIQEHGVDPAEFADANADLPLNGEQELHVEEAIVMIKPGLISLSDLANFYNVDAKEITRLNPDMNWVKPEVGMCIRMPHMLAQVKRGETLRQIAAKYHVPMVSLVLANQTTLFKLLREVLNKVKLLSGPVYRIPVLPEGTVELKAERLAPPEDATPMDGKDDFQELFQLLGYNVVKNENFREYVPTLPLPPKPVQVDANGEVSSVEETPVKEVKWKYNKAIPFHKYLMNQDANSFDSDSKYRGVGSIFQIRHCWMDIFGNQLFQGKKEKDVTKDILPISIGFTDEMLGPNRWPMITNEYEILLAGTKPVLQVRFICDLSYLANKPTKKEEADQARGQGKTLLRAANQLMFTVKRMPELSCTVKTSLMPLESFDIKDVPSLGGFLKLAAELLYAWADGKQTLDNEKDMDKLKKPFTLDIPIDPDKLNPLDIFELNVLFEITREKSFVAPVFRSMESVWRSSTRILPIRDKALDEKDHESARLETSFLRFASNLEKSLEQNQQYFYRTAIGLDRKKWLEHSTEVPIWIVRMAKTDATDVSGLKLLIERENATNIVPTIYAPSPLINEDLELPYRKKFNADGTEILEAQDLGRIRTKDMEAYAQFFLNTFEQILSSEAIPAFEMLESQPTDMRYTEQLLMFKREIAKALSNQLIDVYKGAPESDLDALSSARETYRQQMLHSLQKTYLTDAIAQFHTISRGNLKSNDEDTSRLYGTFLVDGNTLPAGITLPPSKVDIKQYGVAHQVRSFLNMAFVGTKEDPAAITTSPFIKVNAQYWPTHIEHQIDTIPDIEGYEASSWLYFILPDKDQGKDSPLTRSLGAFDVPLPLRSYPEIPALKTQGMEDPLVDQTSFTSPLNSHLLWNYTLTYSRTRHMPQDRVHVRVIFKEMPSFETQADEEGVHLCGALLEYQDYYNSIKKQLKQVEELSSLVGDQQVMVKDMAEKLCSIVGYVKENWVRWQDYKASLPSAIDENEPKLDTLGNHEYRFYLEEYDNNGLLEVALTETSPNPSSFVPIVSIDGYDTESVSKFPLTSGTSHRFIFRFRNRFANDSWLQSDQGLQISKRLVTLKGLNIITESSARAHVLISRNEELIKDKPLALTFVYRTEEHRFERAYLPSLRRDYPIPMTEIGGAPVSLTTLLERFITSLFKGEKDSNQLHLQLECFYSYELENRIFSISLPMFLMPRKNFPVTSDILDQISKHVEEFFVVRNPERRGGKLHFDFTVLINDSQQNTSGGEVGKPVTLLRLTDVVLDLTQIALI
ncbi:hypothetical protein CXK86_20305 [Paenibacillus sp. BGI2013]|nr:hypothetical protein CXK86_20305 [Paenibacillus sp. BGI2013]